MVRIRAAATLNVNEANPNAVPDGKAAPWASASKMDNEGVG